MPPLRLLAIGDALAALNGLGAAAVDVVPCTWPPETGLARDHDALLVPVADAAGLVALASDPVLPATCLDTAVLLLTPAEDAAAEAQLLALGVEAIVAPAATPAMRSAALLRAVQHAVARKRAERASRNAYATDLATGLPHEAQLVEHMAHLLALREREPAPMVLVVLRVDGFAQTAARLGPESANVLRRKVAVRLRTVLRASDVVAALGADSFGVLLGHLEALADGEAVAGKLVRALQQPLTVAGQSCRVAAAVGLALYPEHGKDPGSLLRRAQAQAGSILVGVVGGGQAGAPGAVRSGGAANDGAP